MAVLFLCLAQMGKVWITSSGFISEREMPSNEVTVAILNVWKGLEIIQAKSDWLSNS